MEIAVSDTVGPATEIRAQAELAEEHGYTSFWTQELIDTKDGITTATALGAWGLDLDIVVGLPSPYTRHPAMIATEACSVDDYADGRVRGLAVATSAPEVVQKLGKSLDRPIKRMSETHDILRDIVTEGYCDYDGDIYTMDNWKLRSEFSGEIPLYLAGMGPKMRELAAAKYDGLWLPFNATVPFVADVVEDGREQLAEFDRDPEEFLFALNIPTAVTSEDSELSIDEQVRDVREFTAWHCCSDHIKPLVEQAGVSYDIEALREAVRANDSETIREIVDREFLNTVAAVGPPERVRERYREYVDAGIERPVIYNYGPEEVKLRNVRELAPETF